MSPDPNHPEIKPRLEKLSATAQELQFKQLTETLFQRIASDNYFELHFSLEPPRSPDSVVIYPWLTLHNERVDEAAQQLIDAVGSSPILKWAIATLAETRDLPAVKSDRRSLWEFHGDDAAKDKEAMLENLRTNLKVVIPPLVLRFEKLADACRAIPQHGASGIKHRVLAHRVAGLDHLAQAELDRFGLNQGQIGNTFITRSMLSQAEELMKIEHPHFPRSKSPNR